QPDIALEVRHGACGGGTIDAVGAAAVEPQARERDLQLVDVVAAQLRGGELQQPITERPRCLDQRRPRGLVAHAALKRPTLGLEGADRLFGRRAEDASLGRIRFVTGSGEAALEITDCFTALTRGQREESRNSSSSCRRWPLLLAPTSRLWTSPLSNTRRVGI